MKKWYLAIMVLSIVLLTGFGVFRWQAQSTSSDGALGDKNRIIGSISPKEGSSIIEKNRDNPNFIILDVRTPQEYSPEHISGAINVDYYSNSFRSNLNQLDKGKTYLIYCRSGRRSGLALDVMRELSFSEVYNIAGGILAWKANSLPYLIRPNTG